MKTVKNITLAALVALFITSPSMVHADTVLRSGDSVSVEKDQKIDGDFYVAASTITVSGEVNGDLVSAGGKNTLNGVVSTDALMVGGTVDAHGSVGDDLRIVAGDAVIAEPVTGDVFVMAGTVKVLSTASIGGNLIVYGGDVEVSGAVGGDVIGSVQTLRIDAPVAGKVDVTITKLTLGDRADIKGTVRYVSATELVRAQNAKVGGDVSRNDPVTSESASDGVKALLLPMLVALFTALVWYLIARKYIARIIKRALTRSIRPAATGFIALFATPVIALVLIMTILGSFVGVAALVAYIFAILIAVVSSSAVIGNFVVIHVKKSEVPLSPYVILVGVFTAILCLFIPFVGPVVLLMAFLVTLGAIVDLLLHPDTP
jgi:cytoskeletal protein CcmA (bactofilin family)